MAQVTREKLMQVSPGKFYKAITDFEKYPTFLEEVVSATLDPKSNEEKATVTFELEVVKRFRYVLQFEMKPPTEVKWHLVESDFFKENEGSWVLKADKKNQVQVQYSLKVDFGFFVPGWISKKLTEINLPKMFDAFEKHAKESA